MNSSLRPPITLSPSAVLERRHCMSGKRLVWFIRAGLGSGIMRGWLYKSLLEQTAAVHGAEASTCNACNTTELAKHLSEPGFAPAFACIFIKYPDPIRQKICAEHGALVIVDTIDNHRAFDPHYVKGDVDGYLGADAVLTQTHMHAQWLGKHFGLRTIVLPHPHGNLNQWATPFRPPRLPRPKSLGIVIGDLFHNKINGHDLTIMAGIACAHNMTLYEVHSEPSSGGLTFAIARMGHSSLQLTSKTASNPRQFCPDASVMAELMNRTHPMPPGTGPAWYSDPYAAAAACQAKSDARWREPVRAGGAASGVSSSSAGAFATTTSSSSSSSSTSSDLLDPEGALDPSAWCNLPPEAAEIQAVAVALGIATMNSSSPSGAAERAEAHLWTHEAKTKAPVAPARHRPATLWEPLANDTRPPHFFDYTGQQRFYHARNHNLANQLIDLGLMWPPSNQQGGGKSGGFATINRPPYATRSIPAGQNRTRAQPTGLSKLASLSAPQSPRCADLTLHVTPHLHISTFCGHPFPLPLLGVFFPAAPAAHACTGGGAKGCPRWGFLWSPTRRRRSGRAIPRRCSA